MARKTIPATAAETKLEQVARRWLNSQGKEYDTGAEGAARDLFNGGCASGIVSDLISYSDTTKFYRRHQRDIIAILSNAMSEQGEYDLSELFSASDWDLDDPLALDYTNQNILAWFGFEEAARTVCDRAGIEV